ncbi:MAG: putative lipid II flippase FtsW [Candidatus Marinimicrobia bacterium]|nr:putative lipid II flippase FtsW [Candidatus Neomarinimicrobiota bacterium]MCF7839314.1 putative lipid II flippase FtsW [Candidatus Neomarinimicrobiota bacterium]MCF7903406.1 putative lipid II flippase FtsW [Candidatus Neomarinimicrobiota bacterium]
MIQRVPLDRILLILVLGLFLFGSVSMYSASTTVAEQEYQDASYYLKKHLRNSMVAILVFVIFSQFNHQYFRKMTKPILFIALSLLVVVIAQHRMSNITRPARWLYLGAFSIQVSDLARLAFIIFMADYIHRIQPRLTEFKTTIMPMFLITGLTCTLVVFEPDLSSAMMILAIAIAMFFMGNVRISHISGFLAASISGAMIMAWVTPYMRQRILTFFDSSRDVTHAGYQIHQSLVTLAHGGLSGVGLGDSFGKALYLPEPHTDFVFAIIGEEWGFIGTFLLLSLFLLIFLRGMRIARNSSDIYSMLLAEGLSLSLFLYALANIAVVVDLVPTTGLPLPLVSYGGSHLMITAAMLGILFNIAGSNGTGVLKQSVGSISRLYDA